MSKFFRHLRRSRKLIRIWLLLLSIAIGARIHQYCQNQNAISCDIILDNIVFYGYCFIILTFFIICTIGLHKLLSREDPSIINFKNAPSRFDSKVICIRGKITRVLRDSISEKFKRKAIDTIRNITNDTNAEGRYIHQRFLISSPELRKGHNILVLHNIKFGKVPIKRGAWVEVKGVYLHKPTSHKTFFGRKKTLYGRIHFTHDPKGFIKMLPRKPTQRLTDESLLTKEEASKIFLKD